MISVFYYEKYNIWCLMHSSAFIMLANIDGDSQ